MRYTIFRSLFATACALGALAFLPGRRRGVVGQPAQSLCIGHHPQEYVWYTHSCTGHDEPELDPLSNQAGSAQNLTWTFVLPTNGSMPVDSVGPTFWIGGTVTDPNSLDNQAFLELQFYPNSLLKGCASGGGYNVVRATRASTPSARPCGRSQRPESPSRRRSTPSSPTARAAAR